MQIKFALRLLTLVFTILIVGCVWFDDTHYATFRIRAVHYLNPDINGHAQPVVVTIYQLKTAYMFNHAQYQNLVAANSTRLGMDLIDKKSIEIQPGDKLTVVQQIYPNAHYIGIVVAYRNINLNNWRKVIDINATQKSVKIHLNLESESFNLLHYNA